MSDKEFEKYLKRLERKAKEIASSKKASQKFLIKAGIFTPKGNLTKPYKHLCIPDTTD